MKGLLRGPFVRMAGSQPHMGWLPEMVLRLWKIREYRFGNATSNLILVPTNESRLCVTRFGRVLMFIRGVVSDYT